jgi:alpha/beta superfamily hydrolase
VNARPLDLDVPDGAWAAALLLHPHPDMGGDRFNHVVDALFRRLPVAGIAAARFDFSSSRLEVASDEVAAALDALGDELDGLPLFVVGYSFGAAVALGVDDPGVAGWFLVAPPVDRAPASPLARDPRPKALAVPEHDFSPPPQVEAATSGWPATSVSVIAGADHFLVGATAAVGDVLVSWVGAVVGR